MSSEKLNIVSYYYYEIVGHMTDEDIKCLIARLLRMLVLKEFSHNLTSMGKCVKIVDVCEKIQEK